MNIDFFGRLVLLGIGVFIAFAAVWSTLRSPKEPKNKQPNARTLFLMLVFAGLFGGLGAFGLVFLPYYTTWLKEFKDMVDNPGQQSYAAFLDDVGKGKVPAELQQIGINYAVSHPIEGMETVLNNSINKAPKGTNGENVLKWALDSYNGKQKEIDHFVRTKVGVDSVGQFDPATRQLVYDKMQKLPDNQKRALGIDDKSLQQHRAILRPFPKRYDR
jgi:hypothetical protein